MNDKTDLGKLLKTLTPEHNDGEFVFCSVDGPVEINPIDILASFREKEGLTLITRKSTADELGLPYDFVASWITLKVYSSLEAVGLTAVISKALADEGISCNMMAANYHDHIFVPVKDVEKAMKILLHVSDL